MPTPYEYLGLRPDASLEDIKAAYRNLAKEYHPDVCEDGGATMAAINAAYAILGDPDRRARYDATGKADAEPENALRAAALGMISGEVFKLTNLDPAIFKADLVVYLVTQLSTQRDRGHDAMGENTKIINKLERLKGRFKNRDPEAPNLIERMVDEKIASVKKLNAGNQASIDLYDLAIGILHEYQDVPEGAGFYPYRPAADLLKLGAGSRASPG